MRKRPFKWLWMGTAGVLILLASLAVRIVTYPQTITAGRYDCAIVLGAAVTDEKPSPVFQSRIDHAVTLYQQGIVSHLIFTGGVGKDDRVSESSAARASAVAQGVPLAAIYTESLSRTTQQNLQEAKRLMDQHALKTAVLVSDPLHLYRACTIAEDTRIACQASATPTTLYTTWRSQLPFLWREVYFTLHFWLFRE